MMLMRFLAIFISLISTFGNVLSQGVPSDKELITYYVSSSTGNDKNDGLSALSAKQHIYSVPAKESARVRLKCNDVFFERVFGYKNSIIESYGYGDRPVICGFKILKDTNAWVLAGNNIWVLDLSDETKFDGYSVSVCSNKTVVNNVGLIYNSKSDKVYGHLVCSKDSLKDSGDFYTTELQTQSFFIKQPISKLYWKIDVDPRDLGRLAFSMYDVGIKSMKSCTIRDIAVAGFSIHGVTGCNDCLIENCQIDLIGGAMFVREKAPWCRYGNGIEFWSSCNDNYVTRCIISRTFDCATTIQGNPTSKVIVKNIHFIGNRMYHCRQAFEHFLNDQGQEFGSAYENCSFERNVAYEMGYNEFSSPEPRDCNILSYETKRKSIDICDNIFFGGNHMYGSWMNSGNQKNKVYLYSDQYLFHTHWKTGFKPLLSGNSSSNQAFVNLTADNTEFIVVNRSSLKTRLIKRRILKQVNWKPVGALRKYIQRGCSFGK